MNLPPPPNQIPQPISSPSHPSTATPIIQQPNLSNESQQQNGVGTAESNDTSTAAASSPRPIRQPCLITHFQSTKIIYGIVDMDESLARDFVRGVEIPVPHEMEHVVAYRVDSASQGHAHNDNSDAMSDDSEENIGKTQKATQKFSPVASHALQDVVSRMMKHRNKNAIVATRHNVFHGLEGSVTLKDKVQLPHLSDVTPQKSTSHLTAQILFGQEAIDAVNDTTNPHYTELVRPMKYGHFIANTEQDLDRVLDTHFSLWQYLCYDVLKLKKQQISRMPVVFISSEAFTETEIHLVLDVLLCRMGFNRALIHNELVLASMSVGMNHVCICDIGSTKTSIGCVSDGECTYSRHLAIGVQDMTRLLGELLVGARWPVPNFSLKSPQNQEKLRKIFLEHASVGGLEEHKTLVSLRHEGFEYQLEISDPLRITGMSLLEPNMFYPLKDTMVCVPHISLSWTTQQSEYIQGMLTGISKRKNYGSRARVSKSAVKLEEGVVPTKEETGAAEIGGYLFDDVNGVAPLAQSTPSDDLLPPLDQMMIEGMALGKTRLKTSHKNSKVKVNVIFSGRGANIQGLKKDIVRKLAEHYLLENPDTGIEVFLESDDKNPEWMAWRGACLLTRVEEAHESLWIERREYIAHQNKAFLDKTPFLPSGFVF